MIFFSIIIPSYNRAHLIKETVDTILAQTYPHFEIIIADDGSTDNTKQVIADEYNADQRVKYFFKKNEERGAARNFGIKQARGEYVVFFDSDDLMKTNYLEILAGIIRANPGIFLLAARYNYNNKGRMENHPGFDKLAEGWYGRDLFLRGNMLACNFCVRIKDSNLKLFPEERELASMEDWLFLLLNLEDHKIYISREICLSMRQHDERSMANNQQVIEARKKAVEMALHQLTLSAPEKRKLLAWSHYFCGIHQYLDYKRGASVKEAVAAIQAGGLNMKFILLLIKSFIGRRVIKALR